MFKLKSTVASCVALAMIGGMFACSSQSANSGSGDTKTSSVPSGHQETASRVANSPASPANQLAKADEALAGGCDVGSRAGNAAQTFSLVGSVQVAGSSVAGVTVTLYASGTGVREWPKARPMAMALSNSMAAEPAGQRALRGRQRRHAQGRRGKGGQRCPRVDVASGNLVAEVGHGERTHHRRLGIHRRPLHRRGIHLRQAAGIEDRRREHAKPGGSCNGRLGQRVAGSTQQHTDDGPREPEHARLARERLPSPWRTASGVPASSKPQRRSAAQRPRTRSKQWLASLARHGPTRRNSMRCSTKPTRNSRTASGVPRRSCRISRGPRPTFALSLCFAGGGVYSPGRLMFDAEGNLWSGQNWMPGSQSGVIKSIGGGVAKLSPNGKRALAANHWLHRHGHRRCRLGHSGHARACLGVQLQRASSS